MTNPEIDAIHRELADQLLKASRAGDELALLGTLDEIIQAGMRTAVAVLDVLARKHAEAGDATDEEE